MYRAYYAAAGTWGMHGVPVSEVQLRSINAVGAAIIFVGDGCARDATGRLESRKSASRLAGGVLDRQRRLHHAPIDRHRTARTQSEWSAAYAISALGIHRCARGRPAGSAVQRTLVLR